MSEDCFQCCDCDNISNNCHDFTGCDACEGRICVYCMEECKRGSHTYVCTKCWEDDMTPGDLEEIAKFLLKPHQEEYKSFMEVRQLLRNQEKLWVPRVIIDAQEKDRKGLIEIIKGQGLKWDDCYDEDIDDEESTESEDHKHERDGDDDDKSTKKMKTSLNV